MKKMVRKNTGKMVKAYELGTGTVMEQKMLEEGKMVIKPNGQYELFSQESKSGKGESQMPEIFSKLMVLVSRIRMNVSGSMRIISISQDMTMSRFRSH